MTRLLMRPRLVHSLLLVALVLSISAPPGIAGSPRPAEARQPEGIGPSQPAETGKVVVAFAGTGRSEAEVAAELAGHGLALEKWLPELGLARAAVLGGVGAAAAAASALSAEAGVDYVAEERLSVQVAEAPADEWWSQQWGPEKSGLPAARDITWGDVSVVIAVVDTGVRYFHWDLRDQMWVNPGESEIDPATGKPACTTGIAQNGQDDDGNGYTDDCRGYNFDVGNNEPDDVYGHGTAVAGIAGAATNNEGHYTGDQVEGIAGMGGAARIMPLRALNASGAGSPFNIAEAIRYAADEGAQVINLSLTLAVTYNPTDADTLCRATEYAQGKGTLVVGASGNHSAGGIQPVSYPAACPGVLAVGASTAADTRAYFSDAGSRLDLVAPGEGIFSTLKTSNTSYGRWGGTGNGTSFAAPHVAGAAALVRGLRPDLGPAAIHELLRTSSDDVGDPGFDTATGWGRLNAGRAAAAALDGVTIRVATRPGAGGAVEVRVQATGPGDVPAGSGGRVAFSSTQGTVSPAVVTLDSTGAGTAAFSPASAAGLGSVTATLGTLSVTVSVEVPRRIHLPLVGR